MVGFGIIRVEVVLAVKVHLFVDVHVEGKSSLDSGIDNPFIENWQNSWERPVNHVSVGILIISEVGRSR
ncbi:Uncharacterised protein [Streptococcus pneumoniae]|nr:Uncharacterised protein [Streptococcus pneumoniae]